VNFDYVFVVTYGRSGSTLLQGILNSIPGAEIRGENGSIHFLLFAASQAIDLMKTQAPDVRDATHPWYGAELVPHDEFKRELKDLVTRNILPPKKPGTIVGFKEIRYHHPLYLLRNYTKYLIREYPRAAIIFNTRDLDETVRSNRDAGHAFNEEPLRDADKSFRILAKELPECSYHVHYDDYVGNIDNLRPLFDFLGAPFDRRSIEVVLNKNHSIRTRK
jgi:hypothetical protein